MQENYSLHPSKLNEWEMVITNLAPRFIKKATPLYIKHITYGMSLQREIMKAKPVGPVQLKS